MEYTVYFIILYINTVKEFFDLWHEGGEKTNGKIIFEEQLDQGKI